MIKLDGIGATCDTVVASSNDVQNQARFGYRVVCAFQDSRVQTGMWNSQTNKSGEFVVTETKFLMVRGGEGELIDELRHAAAFATSSSQKAGELATASHRAKDLAEKTAEGLKADLARVRAEREDLVNERSKALDRAQKAENDIAKLRQALGELRMKEILEGK